MPKHRDKTDIQTGPNGNLFVVSVDREPSLKFFGKVGRIRVLSVNKARP